ncbi:MAG: hypothetical protein IBX72_00955 [Nitrospirae bacterium]|nr:hypothetical protein [Nitrospirota bacterium]
MQISRIRQLALITWGFHNYLRRPLTLEHAIDDVRHRMDNREKNFLSIAKNIIYGNKYSPYRKLLLWAGCDYGDLEDSVRHEGIEKTLEKLRDEGVYLTLEEFKSKIPVCRNGLTFETTEPDFDNPFLMGKSIQASTSGSRSKGTRVMYDWDFIAEEAASELILYETHGLTALPLALWLPGLPAISGIHNLLMNIKFRRPPEKWFSHLGSGMIRPSLRNRFAMQYISWVCRMFGLSAPPIELAGIGDAVKVAEWMEKAKRSKGKCVVRTYTSSAVRVVQAAIDRGIDIGGNVIFTGGEPLTERRLGFMESAGVNAFPRYVATESGLIGASCANRTPPDEMHVYLDRLAVIQMQRRTNIGEHNINSFLFTSLLSTTGKVLLNTEIGDFGRLEVKPCSCLFGELGMNVHISEVRSYDKLTGEGMTLLGSDLDDIIAGLIEDAGGCPDDYQFWEKQDDKGLCNLIIAVSPEVRNLNENNFKNVLLDKLRGRSSGAGITSELWKQADTLQVVRAYPEMSKGFKKLPIIKSPKNPYL